ncbi:MAG: hypothetical protein CR997_08045 [Acidobacteria bacterium]|nr:MAG: hypothetical protein CR997_08045 [Acidobacteriota bacterium]
MNNFKISKIFYFSDDFSPEFLRAFHKKITFLNYHRLTWLSVVIVVIHLPLLGLDFFRITSTQGCEKEFSQMIFYSHIAITFISASYFCISKYKKLNSENEVAIFNETLILLGSYLLFIAIIFLSYADFLMVNSIIVYIASLFVFSVFVVLTHFSSLFFFIFNTFLLFYLLQTNGQTALMMNQKINLVVFSLFAWFISRVIYYQQLKDYKQLTDNKNLVESLQKAKEDVKVLSGFLPICSYCKKVRDDEGYWSQLEAYIGKHSEATFSHGVCPACIEKHYKHKSSS